MGRNGVDVSRDHVRFHPVAPRSLRREGVNDGIDEVEQLATSSARLSSASANMLQIAPCEYWPPFPANAGRIALNVAGVQDDGDGRVARTGWSIFASQSISCSAMLATAILDFLGSATPDRTPRIAQWRRCGTRRAGCADRRAVVEIGSAEPRAIPPMTVERHRERIAQRRYRKARRLSRRAVAISLKSVRVRHRNQPSQTLSSASELSDHGSCRRSSRRSNERRPCAPRRWP